MNSLNIIELVSYINDDFIVEADDAEKYFKEQNVIQTKTRMKKIVLSVASLAACICICFCSIMMFKGGNAKNLNWERSHKLFGGNMEAFVEVVGTEHLIIDLSAYGLNFYSGQIDFEEDQFENKDKWDAISWCYRYIEKPDFTHELVKSPPFAFGLKVFYNNYYPEIEDWKGDDSFIETEYKGMRFFIQKNLRARFEYNGFKYELLNNQQENVSIYEWIDIIMQYMN